MRDFSDGAASGGRAANRLRRALAAVTVSLAALMLSGCGWVVSFDTAGNVFVEKVGFDAFGNVRLTGILRGTIDADPGPDDATLTSDASLDFTNYDILLDGDGAYVAAATTAPPRSDRVASTVDASYYRTGIISGTVDVDPGPGVTELTAGDGFSDFYIAKFDGSGSVLWATVFPTDGLNLVWGDLQIDANGDLIVVGVFFGSVDVDPGPGQRLLTSAGRGDVWAAKFSAQGDLVWATSMGGADLDETRGFAIDPQGNVVIGGDFFGAADFGPGPGSETLQSAGSRDGFVAALSGADGQVLRAGALSSIGDIKIATDGVTSGPDGTTIVGTVSGFDASADLDPGPGIAERTGGIFAIRLAGDGSLRWASAMANPDGASKVSAVAVDSEGSTILGGTYGQTVDFDPGPGEVTLSSDGDLDMFVLKLTDAGELDWVNGFGTPGDDLADSFLDGVSAVAVDGGGFIYVAGVFVGPVDFDPGPTERILTSTSGEDIFLLKLDGGGNLVLPATQGRAAVVSD
jgi:hypothetical protein